MGDFACDGMGIILQMDGELGGAWAASVKLVPMASFASLMARSASSALVASTA